MNTNRTSTLVIEHGRQMLPVSPSDGGCSSGSAPPFDETAARGPKTASQPTLKSDVVADPAIARHTVLDAAAAVPPAQVHPDRQDVTSRWPKAAR